MKKTITTLSILSILSMSVATSQAALMFVGFDSDSEQFSFVSDVDITSGTQLFFTDDEWGGTNFNDANEGTMSITLSATLTAGSVVIIDGPEDSVSGASGTLAHDDTSFNMSGSGDSIYAFSGSRATPVFLGFLTTNSDTAPDTGSSIDRSSFSGTDVFAYTGPTSGEASFSDYAALIQDVENWTAQGDGSGSQSANFAPPSDFTVVPEPSSTALLGLGGLALILRRRR